jgi:hypothetical protein
MVQQLSFRKTVFTVFLATLIHVSIYGQNLENPSEKYRDAYKSYLNAKCPIDDYSIKNFVYFSTDRESIQNHPFLKISRFTGAQIMYSWSILEPEKDQYDFSKIVEDYEYLKSNGKMLFIQLQDATFNPQWKAVPNYLLTKEYDGGVVMQIDDRGKPEGWVAKRWNANVQKRFALLLDSLGKFFDGKIEGINLQETAIEVSQKQDPKFSPELYTKCIKANMLSLKKAFSKSTTMQYANFMPGEWLPWEDKGYLRSIFQYSKKIGVGIGGPDLMFKNKGQLNHILSLMHEGSYTIPLGIAVQDGNYIGKTNTEENLKDHINIVPQLYAFAKDFLKVNYIFWVCQEPYFTEDVIPCFLKK